MTKLEMKKYLTLITFITILIVAPLTTPIAFADDDDDGKDKETTTVIATVVGEVTDLGLQKYDIKGKNGPIYWLYGLDIAEPKSSFELKANVEDGIVDGKMKLEVKGETDDSKVKLKLDIPVDNGISDPLLTVGDDFIPMLFVGTGESTLKIDKDKIISVVTVVVDTTTAQHPFIGGVNTGQVNLWGCNTEEASYFACLGNPYDGATFFLSVDVNKFKVKYTGVLLEGIITIDGEDVGTLSQIADADEDHVTDTEKDKGTITLNFFAGDLIGETSGKYKGESVQNPGNNYLYDGTGKFSTKGDMKLKGTYETSWLLPLVFVSTFTATVK